jgi:hypothetical protein
VASSAANAGTATPSSSTADAPAPINHRFVDVTWSPPLQVDWDPPWVRKLGIRWQPPQQLLGLN